MNLHDAVGVLVVSIFVVIQHSLLCRLAKLGQEPLNTADVKQALHAEEVDSDLNDVTLADLHYRLGQRPLSDPFVLVRGSVVGVTLIWVHVLGLVPMDPHQTIFALRHHIEFVRCHMLLSCRILVLLTFDKSLSWTEHIGAPTVLYVQFVGEMGAKAFVDVLGVVEHLAN